MIIEKEHLYSVLESEDFDNFKSNVCHYLKNTGDLKFIYIVIKSDIITWFYEKQMYREAFYMLAALDYISKENQIPLCTKYENLRCFRFERIIWPKQADLVSKVMKNDNFKEELLRKTNPEFLKYNIVEGDMRDVC